jgi:hypothetical protein
MQAKVLQPGTTIEGLGTVNEDGLISLVPANPPAPSRRSRPPPKKKGGPGRGKKRVTFTNPDGSTYTTIVPNATKIVPQPGQTVKHVAKGEDAGKDVTMGEAPRQTNEGADGGEEEEEGDDDEEGDDGDDDEDDDREDGEIPDDDAEVAASPVKKATPAEPRPVDPMPVASTSAEMLPAAESLPTAAARIEITQDQPLEEETNPDVDVEMQDRPADGELEAKPAEPEPMLEPVPESLPEPETQSQPASQPQSEPISEPEPEPEPKEQTDSYDIAPEVAPTLDPKPDSENENTQTDETAEMDDAMDTDPVEALVPNAAAPQEDQQDRPVVEEPAAPETEIEQPTIVAEVEASITEPEVTQSTTETPLGDTVEIVETSKIVEGAEPVGGTTVVETADVVVEAPKPDVQLQQETTAAAVDEAKEPEVQTFEEGEEDLLGSLEKSLGS